MLIRPGNYRLNGDRDNIEYILKDKTGNWVLKEKYGFQIIDCFYFCMQDNGKRIVEVLWKKDGDYSSEKGGAIVIKDEKKLIYIDEHDKGYGFGYNEIGKDQGFVLYIRIRTGARLMWANSASNAVKCAMEISKNPDNTDELDYLLEFMQKNDDSEKVTEKQNESEG